jgi:chromosome segregation ATPase
MSKIKVIMNGGSVAEPGYQLQRLGDKGQILSVRPATVEEYRLYEVAKSELLNGSRNYAGRKEAEETLKKLVERQESLKESVQVAENAADVARSALKSCHDAQDALAAEVDQQRARAEAAEAELIEAKREIAELRQLIVEPTRRA